MKKVLISILLVIFLAVSFCGCSKEEKEQAHSELNSINLYCVRDNSIVATEEKYQIKQPDSVVASIDEVMPVEMENVRDVYKYNTYMIDADNNVTLNFSSEEADEVKIMLANAAVTKTLFQIKAINRIGIQITDENGEIISFNEYKRDSFYLYDCELEECPNKREVTIYLQGDDENSLVGYTINFSTDPNESIEEKIVKYIASNGEIPEKTEINSIKIIDDTCYIDVSDSFINATETTKPEISVYAVVNSITSLDGITKVQFFVDGETVKMYRDEVDISKPLTFNEELVK